MPKQEVTKTGNKKITRTVDDEGRTMQTQVETVNTQNPNVLPAGISEITPQKTGFFKDAFGDKVPIEQSLAPETQQAIKNQRQGELLTKESIVQPQPSNAQKQPLQRAAEIGVTPAVTAANIISKGLKLITGQDIGQITAEQFASTGIGKAIGLATDVAGIAAATTGAIAALGGAEGISAGLGALRGGATAVEAGSVVTQVPRVLSFAVGKSGLLTKALKSTVGKLIIGGTIVGLPIKIKNDSRNALSSTIQTMDLIKESFEAGLISPADALDQYNDLESQIKSQASSLHGFNRISTFNYLLGGKDIEVDIVNALAKLQLKKRALLTAFAQPR